MKIKQFFIGETKEVDWLFIESIPEFKKLSETKQSAKWHKEGDAYTHTRIVTRKMCERLSEEKDMHYYRVMVAAAICHDLGKGTTTYFDEAKGDFSSKCHGAAGAIITRTLLENEDVKTREMVCYMVRNHMTLHHILEKDGKGIDRKLIEMSYGWMSVKDMLILKECDSMGSLNDIEGDKEREYASQQIRCKAELLDCYDRPFKFESAEQKHRYFIGCDLAAPKTFDYETFNVWVMVGLPGSGKNTVIEHYFHGMPSISRDDIRTEIGLKGEKPQGNKDEEERVTKIFDERVVECLKKHNTFVVNNVNVRKRYREMLLSKFVKYNVCVNYVYVNTDVDTCKSRRDGLMPLSVIDRMWGYFDFPTESEYDALYIMDGKEPLKKECEEGHIECVRDN